LRLLLPSSSFSRHRRIAALAGAILFFCACGGDAAPGLRAPASTPGATGEPVSATDDVGRAVELSRPASRVISLLPAGTETLFALGAGDAVVGRTRYDLEPELAHLPSVGGGLDPSLETIVSLRPDLVIAFETASESRIRPRIEQLGIPVFAIQTEDTADIYRNIRSLGTLVGRDSAARVLLASIRSELEAVRASVPPGPRPEVVYVASIEPAIVAGPGTYLGELIELAGADLLEVGGARGAYWPQISLETLVREQPDIVVLPVGSDPTSSVARLRAEPGWRELRAVQQGRIAVVPTDLMSRPGPRLPEIARLLRGAFAEHGTAR
jgi:iron complex transport system substrate-binding protein